MGDGNHNSIDQKFSSLEINTPRLICGLAGISGKVTSPTSPTLMSSILDDFTPTAVVGSCGHMRLASTHVPQVVSNTVVSFGGNVLATFANDFSGAGLADAIYITLDVYWSNPHATAIGATFVLTYKTRTGANTLFTTLPGGVIGTGPITYSITDLFGSSGYADNGYLVVIGGGI